MSEEELAQIDEDVETAFEESQQEEIEREPEQQQEPDPEQEQAKGGGWCPKDEWRGDPDKWVDAGEFNRRQSLFDTIHGQDKTIKELNRKMESVTKYAKTIEEKTRERVIKELETKRRQAVEAGDTDAYDQLSEEIKEASVAPDIEEEKEPENNNLNPEGQKLVSEFAAKNEWFEKDMQMTKYMVATVEDLCSRGVDLGRAMQQAEGEVKSIFKHKLENPNKSKPNRVMQGNNGESRQAKRSLSREEMDVVDAMGMSVDEYLKSVEGL